MTTSVANLDLTQYVKVNSGSGAFTLQAHRDTVRIAFSDVKPSRDNIVFHELGGTEESILQVPYTETGIWVLAMTDRSKLTITNYPLVRVGVTEDSSNKTYNTDAWFRNKVVLDESIFHGMFTYNIPADMWYEMIDDVEQPTFVSAVSTDGKMVLSSGLLNEKRQLRSFRNPRYEPNRGHLYSLSAILPSKDSIGERSFGVFTGEAGVGFRLRSGVLYAFRRTTVSGVTSDIEEVIDVPSDIDLEKGNVFDAQFQWRGVGSYFFYINLTLVHTMDLLGTLTELSLFNPALPAAFESINQSR